MDRPSHSATPAGPPLLVMAKAYMASQAVYVAAELGIADHLADGPRTADQLAEATSSHPPSLLRLLRAVTALGILEPTESGGFALTEMGHQLRSDVPDSLRDVIRMACQSDFWRPWGELLTSVRSGQTAFDLVFGMPIFDHLARHPEKAAVFNTGMANVTRQVAPHIAGGYDFSRFGTIVDIGGGDGTLLAEILRSVPTARGILFDRPAVVEGADPVLGAAGVADRCQVVAGDFFQSVPSGADAYLMKTVIHDWDDERAVAILRNCREAMADDGRVLMVERLVTERPTPRDIDMHMLDLNMLVTQRGKERTDAEYGEILAAAGLSLAAVSDPMGSFGVQVVEAVPA